MYPERDFLFFLFLFKEQIILEKMIKLSLSCHTRQGHQFFSSNPDAAWLIMGRRTAFSDNIYGPRGLQMAPSQVF